MKARLKMWLDIYWPLVVLGLIVLAATVAEATMHASIDPPWKLVSSSWVLHQHIQVIENELSGECYVIVNDRSVMHATPATCGHTWRFLAPAPPPPTIEPSWDMAPPEAVPIGYR